MVRARNAEEMISRLGGEIQYRESSGTIIGDVTGGQSNLVPPNPSPATESRIPYDPGISSQRFDILTAKFEKAGAPIQVAKTYAAAILEAGSDIDISVFLSFNDDGSVRFTQTGLSQMNKFRPKTSQVGYRSDVDNNLSSIGRTILD